MITAVVTAKGQVVIPAKIRRELGIKPGTRLVFDQKKGSFEVRPITDAYIDSIQGMLQRKAGEKPVTQELIEEHAAEIDREEAEIEKRGI
ncbi:AbrB/MazE/SpoVT family DNA-binding domain-containing protein [Pontiella agarivorans]|uniref:AbrB/MazE/SpoVT family DNA-binding domain-containing protein n=1 Tax=Pontiella agarivorans TaxID=3038953 RepID=A0ABU5MVF7_9BACT|nr:AbrB/MazE/SpoVT family DNA-binding domain-containing protein [Pontiella agarivorans]MDZ8118209.1 AbrB/MazE/SpoVT family DNA-binding domain-containing protein [Pontiella agarivorans]